MAPKRVGTLDPTIRKVLTNGLVTRFGISLEVAKKFLLKVVEQWANCVALRVGTSFTRMILFPDARTAKMRLLYVCVNWFF